MTPWCEWNGCGDYAFLPICNWQMKTLEDCRIEDFGLPIGVDCKVDNHACLP